MLTIEDARRVRENPARWPADMVRAANETIRVRAPRQRQLVAERRPVEAPTIWSLLWPVIESHIVWGVIGGGIVGGWVALGLVVWEWLL